MAEFPIDCSYCTVSVNVVVGVPQNTGPVAVTVTFPAVEGNVSWTVAAPFDAVRTILWLRVPALAVNSKSTFPAVAPVELAAPGV